MLTTEKNNLALNLINVVVVNYPIANKIYAVKYAMSNFVPRLEFIQLISF